MYKVKVPRTEYDEIELQPCPICGGCVTVNDEGETIEVSNILGKQFVHIDKVLVYCNSCNLRADLKHWNGLQYNKEIENDTSN